MPKFLGGIVIIKTFETYASSADEAREFIRKWQEDETEQPEGGIKATRYKLGWDEFNLDNPVPERDKVLAAFLNLMLNQIPGVPREVEANKIITPPGFSMLEAPAGMHFTEGRDSGEDIAVANICRECQQANYVDGECPHCGGKEPLST